MAKVAAADRRQRQAGNLATAATCKMAKVAAEAAELDVTRIVRPAATCKMAKVAAAPRPWRAFSPGWPAATCKMAKVAAAREPASPWRLACGPRQPAKWLRLRRSKMAAFRAVGPLPRQPAKWLRLRRTWPVEHHRPAGPPAATCKMAKVAAVCREPDTRVPTGRRGNLQNG